jgi:hypothetical protein
MVHQLAVQPIAQGTVSFRTVPKVILSVPLFPARLPKGVTGLLEIIALHHFEAALRLPRQAAVLSEPSLVRRNGMEQWKEPHETFN